MRMTPYVHPSHYPLHEYHVSVEVYVDAMILTIDRLSLEGWKLLGPVSCHPLLEGSQWVATLWRERTDG